MKLFLGAGQLACTPEDTAANTTAIGNLVRSVTIPEEGIIAFPELVDFGYNLDSFKYLKNSPFGFYKKQLMQFANQSNKHLFLGGCEVTETVLYNSLFVANPHQTFMPVYKKIALFANEQSIFESGLKSEIYSCNEILIGLHICFDLRFPELFYYRDEQPLIQIVSAAWPLSRIEHWKSLLIARAIENQCYIVAANRVGSDSNITFGGNSLIISPWGEIIAEADRNATTVISAQIETDEIIAYRNDFPILEKRRSICGGT